MLPPATPETTPASMTGPNPAGSRLLREQDHQSGGDSGEDLQGGANEGGLRGRETFQVETCDSTPRVELSPPSDLQDEVHPGSPASLGAELADSAPTPTPGGVDEGGAVEEGVGGTPGNGGELPTCGLPVVLPDVRGEDSLQGTLP